MSKRVDLLRILERSRGSTYKAHLIHHLHPLSSQNLNERKQTRTQSETSQNKGISLGALSQNRAAQPKTPVHITISQDVDVQMESIESDKVSDKHVPFEYSPSTPHSGYSFGKSEPMGLGY